MLTTLDCTRRLGTDWLANPCFWWACKPQHSTSGQLQKQQRLNGLFTVNKLTRVWIITGNQSLFLQVKDWVCNDPGCPSLDELLKETKKETYKLNHLPIENFQNLEAKKCYHLIFMEKFLENLEKTKQKQKHWKRDQNEIAVTEISVNKFLKTCCFAPFFQHLQINICVRKRSILITLKVNQFVQDFFHINLQSNK